MKPVLLHTFLRFVLLVVVFGVSYLVGMRGVFLFLMSFVISSVLSIFVLRGPRSQLGAASVTGYFHRMNDRLDAATRKEDYDGPLPGAVNTENTAAPAASIDLTDGEHSRGDDTPRVTPPAASEAPKTADSPRKG